MHLIAIVWTCVIIGLTHAKTKKHITSPASANIAKDALNKCIKEADLDSKLYEVRETLQPLHINVVQKEKTFIPLVQAVANRLVSRRAIDWPAGKVTVEVHTVLAFTFMIFRKYKIKKAKVGNRSDEDLATEFFNNSDRMKGIREELPNVPQGRTVLEIGYGVRVERATCPFTNTYVHACIVFFTTNDLLANIVPRTWALGVFNAKTTLHAANYVLKLLNNGKDVLFSTNVLIDGLTSSYKSIRYQVLSDDAKIQRVDENGKVLDNNMLELSGVQWKELAYGNAANVSYGFGAWSKKVTRSETKTFLIIFSHCHDNVILHREMPVPEEKYKPAQELETVVPKPKIPLAQPSQVLPQLRIPESSNGSSQPPVSSPAVTASSSFPNPALVMSQASLTRVGELNAVSGQKENRRHSLPTPTPIQTGSSLSVIKPRQRRLTAPPCLPDPVTTGIPKSVNRIQGTPPVGQSPDWELQVDYPRPLGNGSNVPPTDNTTRTIERTSTNQNEMGEDEEIEEDYTRGEVGIEKRKYVHVQNSLPEPSIPLVPVDTDTERIIVEPVSPPATILAPRSSSSDGESVPEGTVSTGTPVQPISPTATTEDAPFWGDDILPGNTKSVGTPDTALGSSSGSNGGTVRSLKP